MKERIEQLITRVLYELDLSDITILITPTQDPVHGDYATNVAFQIAKKLGKSPLEAATLMVEKIREYQPEIIKEVQVAPPGFINFTVTNFALAQALSSEHKKIASSSFARRKVMVEFTDPNPFKEFHIGHLYSNIVGESISRLLEAVGAEVRRVCYQGDVGLHVAKAIYGLKYKLEEANMTLSILAEKSVEERAKLLGQAYALGATKYEEDESAKAEIITLNKAVYDKSPEIVELYNQGKAWSLEYFESMYRRLMDPPGDKAFRRYYFESEAGPLGIELVKKYKDTIFEESQGAVIFPGEKYGLHSRVFINSLGLPTYEAKELGLAVTKYQEYPFDVSIMVTGNEIDEYFKVLLKALSLIEPEIASKMKHISHGMVRLPEGKMSSRTGKVVTGEWLMDEAVRRATVLAKSQGQSVDGESTEVAEMVGIGAIKWALLRSGIGKDVEFSFDESVSFEGNSGPYLQYSYVRTRSILSKAGEGAYGLDPQLLHFQKEERELLVLLGQYQDVVIEAAEKYSPNTLCTYLFGLAQQFNLFYQKYPILKEEDAKRTFRLMLTSKVGDVIRDGLYLLGIQTPEHM